MSVFIAWRKWRYYWWRNKRVIEGWRRCLIGNGTSGGYVLTSLVKMNLDHVSGCVVVAAHLGCCLVAVFLVQFLKVYVEGYKSDIYGVIDIPLIIY